MHAPADDPVCAIFVSETRKKYTVVLETPGLTTTIKAILPTIRDSIKTAVRCLSYPRIVDAELTVRLCIPAALDILYS